LFIKEINDPGTGSTPIILATQETEIRRIVLQCQSGQIVYKTLSLKNPSQKRASRVAQGVGTDFSTIKKIKKTNGGM
jgi:hypothetical protein